MNDPSATKNAVREAVSEIVGHKVGDDETIVSSGLIDSLAVLKLICKIEQKLGIHIAPDGLQPDDFDTIAVTLETLERIGV